MTRPPGSLFAKGNMTRKSLSGQDDLFNVRSPVMPAPTLVGIPFRKGAKEALALLRKSGYPAMVTLLREPLNPHDPNAIRVFVDLKLFKAAEIDALFKLGAKPLYVNMLMLGYVDRVAAERWAKVLDLRDGKATAVADLGFNPPILTLLYD